jgi:hypothetical protein
MLEEAHLAGYTYNYLKLNNIMLGFDRKLPKEQTEESAFTQSSMHLVDFGFETRFIHKNARKTVNFFQRVSGGL